MERITQLSKFISLILRHKPDAIGISLDRYGWANVQELISGINATGSHSIDLKTLQEIVQTDDKQRYSFNEDQTMIRANQGHSICVDVELEESVPPDVLYHGTGEKSVSAIDERGLLPMNRLFVHLSTDYETAEQVGKRHGKPVVYLVNCKDMVALGYKFYLSSNQVWLTKSVPTQFLQKAGAKPL